MSKRKPPFVQGPIAGQDMLAAHELEADHSLELSRNQTVTDEQGTDLFERARAGSMPMSLPHLFIQECRFNGGDYVSSGNNPAWFDLPAGRIPYPRLLTMGALHWEHTGVYFNNGAVVQTLEFELLVDGAPCSPACVLSWPITAVAGFPTITIFTADLRVIGDYDNATLYHLEGRLRMQEGHSGTFATVLDSTKSGRPVIDGTAGRTLGFRFRRALNQANEALTMKTSLAWQLAQRSGF